MRSRPGIRSESRSARSRASAGRTSSSTCGSRSSRSSTSTRFPRWWSSSPAMNARRCQSGRARDRSTAVVQIAFVNAFELAEGRAERAPARPRRDRAPARPALFARPLPPASGPACWSTPMDALGNARAHVARLLTRRGTGPGASARRRRITQNQRARVLIAVTTLTIGVENRLDRAPRASSATRRSFGDGRRACAPAFAGCSTWALANPRVLGVCAQLRHSRRLVASGSWSVV